MRTHSWRALRVVLRTPRVCSHLNKQECVIKPSGVCTKQNLPYNKRFHFKGAVYRHFTVKKSLHIETMPISANKLAATTKFWLAQQSPFFPCMFSSRTLEFVACEELVLGRTAYVPNE